MRGCKILWTDPTEDDTADDIEALMSKEDAARFEREMNSGERNYRPVTGRNEGRFALLLLVALVIGGALYLTNAYLDALNWP